MDSLVNIDILNLGDPDISLVTSLIGDTTTTSAHETDADLDSYRIEYNDLQSEVSALLQQKKKIEADMFLCQLFKERAATLAASVVPPPPPPSKSGGSKWGILKSSILAKPEEIVAPTEHVNVHLPVQPEIAKFFYLAERLEMARRTSRFVGIRAKAPRAEYLEKCAELRDLILTAAKEQTTQLQNDVSLIREIEATATRTTLSILEHPSQPAEDRPFDLHMLGAAKGAIAEQLAPPSASTQRQRSSVSFAPSPPPSGNSGDRPSPLRAAAADVPAARRSSILNSFRSRSNTTAFSKAELDKALDPELLAFQLRAAAIVTGLADPSELRASAAPPPNASTPPPPPPAPSLPDTTTPLPAMEAGEDSGAEYREALQAHCAETLNGFRAEMEQKMADCLQHCQQALHRRTAPLSEIKGRLFVSSLYVSCQH